MFFVSAPGGALDLHHLEILFARTAIGTQPIRGDIIPRCPGIDAFVRDPIGLVVNVPANNAHIGFHRVFLGNI